MIVDRYHPDAVLIKVVREGEILPYCISLNTDTKTVTRYYKENGNWVMEGEDLKTIDVTYDELIVEEEPRDTELLKFVRLVS
jgi:hypothetical protein